MWPSVGRSEEEEERKELKSRCQVMNLEQTKSAAKGRQTILPDAGLMAPKTLFIRLSSSPLILLFHSSLSAFKIGTLNEDDLTYTYVYRGMG